MYLRPLQKMILNTHAVYVYIYVYIFIMEKPIFEWDDLGGNTHPSLFSEVIQQLHLSVMASGV